MRKVFKIKYIYSSLFIVGLLSTMVSCNKEPVFIDFEYIDSRMVNGEPTCVAFHGDTEITVQP